MCQGQASDDHDVVAKHSVLRRHFWVAATPVPRPVACPPSDLPPFKELDPD